MAWNPIFTALRDELMRLFFTEAAARTVVLDATMDDARVPFQPAAIDNWRAILVEAQNQQKVLPLLDVARQRYPAWEPLQRAREQYLAWVAAGGPTSPLDQALDALAAFNLSASEAGQPRIAPTLRTDLTTLMQRHPVFGGRQDELHALDAFVDQQPGGYFFVTGPAGFGKSSLLGHWIQQRSAQGQPVCYHFMNRSEDSAGERATLEDLCEQLAAHHGLGGTITESVERLRNLYPKLLAIPPLPGHKLVLVLDGLDEATDWEPRPIHFPPNLPPGLFVVFSARQIPNTDWLAKCGLTGRAETRQLGALGKAQIKDLLLNAGGPAAVLAQDSKFVQDVLTCSDGDPFYLNFLVQDILDGKITAANIKDQPQGLDDFFAGAWAELDADVDTGRAEIDELLGILVVARGRLRPEDIAEISPLLQKGTLLNKELGGKLRRYLVGDKNTGYAITHPRFGDYIRDNVFFPAQVAAFREQILTFCGQWANKPRVYGLTYYAAHLEDAAQHASTPDQRHACTRELVQVTRDLYFQELHKTHVMDLDALHNDLRRALTVAVADDHTSAAALVIQAALALVDFRLRELRPGPIFERAAQGNIVAARRRLDLFEIEPPWYQISLLLIGWLAADQDPAGALALRSEAFPVRPDDEPLASLWDWLSHVTTGTPPPDPLLPGLVTYEEVRSIVDRASGRGQLDVYDRAGMALNGAQPGPDAQFLVHDDGPKLVQYAIADPSRGDALLQQYIDAHTGYAYQEYRNLVLAILLEFILHHPTPSWVQCFTTAVTQGALGGGRLEYREGLPLIVMALDAWQGSDRAAVDTYRNHVLDLVQRLQADTDIPDDLPVSLRGSRGDTIGAYKRTLAVLALTYDRLFGDPAQARTLRRRAQRVPYGYAMYGTSAYFNLAEANYICDPSDERGRRAALSAARRAAHNVQDPTLCARMTARWNALSGRWWLAGPGLPAGGLQTTAQRLQAQDAEDRVGPEFAAYHCIGQTYHRRLARGRMFIPWDMRAANTLAALELVYHRPLEELQRLNAGHNWTPTTTLDPGTAVAVPDPGMPALVAMRLAAEALVQMAPAPAMCSRFISSLVPVTVDHPTALDTLLGYLLLANPPTDPAVIDELRAVVPPPQAPDRLALQRPPGAPG